MSGCLARVRLRVPPPLRRRAWQGWGVVGIVIVSHSARIADGVVELARQIAGPAAVIEAAGGVPDHANPIGTDAHCVAAAITRAAGGDGVLVLMDLGSAVVSAGQACALLDPQVAAQVELCEAPLVEGAVAAAVAAAIGSSLADVAAEACKGLAPKVAHLGDRSPTTAAPRVDVASDDWHEATIVVTIPMGLHARPAARFVQTAAGFDAEIVADNLSSGAGPARARSLTDVATLGASQGHQVRLRARGTQARQALTALMDLAARGFDDQQAPAPPSTVTTRPLVHQAVLLDVAAIRGLAASGGVAVGRARRLRRGLPTPREHGDPAGELAALTAALDRAHADLAALRDTLASQAGEAHATMLDAQLALLHDDALIGPARTAIAGGTRAEVAWEQAISAAVERFAALDDPYLRARADDVREVGRRILDHVMGMGATVVLRGPGILVARELGAAATATLDLSLVCGIVVATGSPTSHSAILARALGVPAVVNAGDVVLTIGEETMLMVDGDTGTITIEPDEATIAAAKWAQVERASRHEQARREAGAAAITRDGVVVEVVANISGADESRPAVEGGADGVGLFRTEFLFMNRDAPPSQDEQLKAYRAAALDIAGRPLIIRTLDAGADKPVAYLDQTAQQNPFLGRRGIRLSLAFPEVFRAQLRAILRVAAEHPQVAVMFPMVATLGELRHARAQLQIARDELEAAGMAAGMPQVGVMIEVPSAALLVDALAPEVDFFSIGTNDLTQYVLAAERGNPLVADLADAAHPAVLRLIARVCAAADDHGRRVGVCGEAAADPEIVPVLVGLGVRELSLATPGIGQIKRLVRTLDTSGLAQLSAAALACTSAAQVRALVRASPVP